MASRGKLKVMPAYSPRLYFNENLTRTSRKPFRKTRARGKEMQYKFVWAKNARIFAKMSVGSPVVRISCVEQDIEKMVYGLGGKVFKCSDLL